MKTDMKYFNVKIEFDKEKIDRTIGQAITADRVGYVCVVESNNLTVANNHPPFMDVMDHSLINSCDGSVLALMLGHIHHQPFQSYTGADIFTNYIQKKTYKHYFLGNTPQVLEGLRNTLTAIDPRIKEMKFCTLPFRSVEEFNYQEIAQRINKDGPDIIWVSLGAPKQEMFMNKLQPYLNRGVMVGIGAVFNFNSSVGHVKRAPKWMIKLRLEWLYRALEEPKKNIPRYWNFIKILPGLIREEKRKLKQGH